MVLPAFISDQHGEIKETNGIGSGFRGILSEALDQEFSHLRSDEAILAAILLHLQPVSGSRMLNRLCNHAAVTFGRLSGPRISKFTGSAEFASALVAIMWLSCLCCVAG